MASLFFQYNKRVRFAIEGGAQNLPIKGAIAFAQSQILVRVSPAVGVLRRPIFGEGSVVDRACDSKLVEVLAENTFPERSDVLERA